MINAHQITKEVLSCNGQHGYESVEKKVLECPTIQSKKVESFTSLAASSGRKLLQFLYWVVTKAQQELGKSNFPAGFWLHVTFQFAFASSHGVYKGKVHLYHKKGRENGVWINLMRFWRKLKPIFLGTSELLPKFSRWGSICEFSPQEVKKFTRS